MIIEIDYVFVEIIDLIYIFIRSIFVTEKGK